MTTLQRQARALGDPTRHRIFEYIADSDRPADVSEMTAHFGLNHNAIRQHLAKLVDAGLVVESTSTAKGRGRPKLEYTVDPTADGRWGVAGPYERLSLWLSEIIRTGQSPIEVGRRVGRELRSSKAKSRDAVADLERAMARSGFEPEVRQRGQRVTMQPWLGVADVRRLNRASVKTDLPSYRDLISRSTVRVIIVLSELSERTSE